MKIRTMSRSQALDHVATVPTAIISIYTPGDKQALLRISSLVRAVTWLKFRDIDPDSIRRNGETVDPSTGEVVTMEMAFHDAFSDDQARDVLLFALTHKDHIEELVIHCDAGRSRSVGMAEALALFLGEADQVQSIVAGKSPNAHVKSTLLRVALTENIEPRKVRYE